MSIHKQLSDYSRELDECVRCGACQAQCPSYLAIGKEGAAARGKIVLAAEVLAGRMELDEEGKRDLALCLLCGACARTCPNHVPTDAIVSALRREISEKDGLSTIGKGVAALTGNPRLLGTLVRGTKIFSSLLFRRIPETSGLRLRFSPQNLQDRVLPPLPRRNLFSRLPERLQGKAGKATLAFFAGCTITYLYPEMGEATARLLNRLGYTVLIPRGQGCCGMPALSSGNGALVEQLAHTNTAAFDTAAFPSEPIEHIITACASCGGALTRFYGEMQTEALHDFSGKVMDIHAFLKKEGCIDTLAALPKNSDRVKVCYHDPCHLKNHGITREPRELLRALPTVDYVEMDGAALCCGLGGTFSASQPGLSRAIADRKIAGLSASGAELVASGCPGCIMQLNDIIHRAGLPMRAVHTMNLALAALEEGLSDTAILHSGHPPCQNTSVAPWATES
ncbi:MAG: (Fe-S)-binding protein [Desulfobulbaceae bacterium]|nr:(Fe-S)-binding protein [Desulfobulbaceae bacterium]